MGVDNAPAAPSALTDFKSWLPFATFTDSEKLAEAALAAKTVVAEARAPAPGFAPSRPAHARPPAAPQARLKEATDATRLAAEVRARRRAARPPRSL